MVVALFLLARRIVESGGQGVSALYQLEPVSFAGALLLTLSMLLLMPLGWICALAVVGVRIPFRLGYVIYYRTSILRYIPGSIWNFPGRAYLSQQHGIQVSTFAKGTFFELFFLLSTAGILAGWGMAIYRGDLVFLGLSAIALAAMVTVVVWPYRWLPTKVQDSFLFYPVDRAILAGMALIYLAVWLSYGAAVGLLLSALPEVHSVDLVLFIPVNTAAWVIGFLSPSPSGIGVRELGLSIMLGPVLGTSSILAALIQRLMELSLEGVLWVIARVISV